MSTVQPLPPCRLYVDGACSGHVNMQRDEHLLTSVVDDPADSCVRIYRWSEPTVSLGYFQKHDAQVDPRVAHCPRVRRVTGGGAILHDAEITYSCVVPDTHPVRATPVDLYDAVHTGIIHLLARCGAECSMRQDVETLGKSTDSVAEPFLCFLRSDPRDVTCRGSKVLGSAQRRRRGTILQHGSILLRSSGLTPEIPGILDLVPDFDEANFCAQLPETVAGAIAQQIRPQPKFPDIPTP